MSASPYNDKVQIKVLLGYLLVVRRLLISIQEPQLEEHKFLDDIQRIQGAYPNYVNDRLALKPNPLPVKSMLCFCNLFHCICDLC